MTTLHKFLRFNKRCPVCNNPLTLYMQWIDSMLYKATEETPGTFYFTEFNHQEIHLNDDDDDDDEDDEEKVVVLMDYGDRFDIAFSQPSLFNTAKQYHIYLYYLCKAEGFSGKKFNQINIIKGCYYRSTPLMEFKQFSDGWRLGYLIEEFSDIINKDETFCLRTRKNSIDNIYVLNRDLEKQITEVWYFTATDEQRVDPQFKPNMFQKELPLIARPTFDDKGKIIDRINSWVIMS